MAMARRRSIFMPVCHVSILHNRYISYRTGSHDSLGEFLGMVVEIMRCVSF